MISNHSKDVAAFGNQLDFLGIVVLMWGSTIPTVYYGFWCSQKLQIFYCTMVKFPPPLYPQRLLPVQVLDYMDHAYRYLS